MAVTVLARALDLLVPAACVACGLPGADLCRWCLATMAPPSAPACARCGHPWAVEVGACAECPRRIDLARHATAYAGAAAAAVAGLKDARRRGLAREMAALVGGRIAPPPAGAVIVPVPLARARERQRGFNQARLLADALGRRWGREVRDVLVRPRDGPPQRGSAAGVRAAQVRGAFAARPGAPAPEVAWLVDDVLTTGATLAACALALRRGGAREVCAVTFARALRGAPHG